jgi:DNA replication protein
MAKFAGFPAGKAKFTRVPDVFFRDLLPEIDSILEMKIVLYAVWFLEHQEGTIHYITRADFSNDERFITSLGKQASHNLDEGLHKVVERGVLLRAASSNEGETIYFPNSARGRAAAEAYARGDWSLEDGRDIHLTLEKEDSNIFRLYEENIGPLTPMIADMLRDAEKTYPAGWVEEAMRLAVQNNVRRWRYIDTILQSWQKEGRHGTDRRDNKKSHRRYIEGKYADLIEH